MSDRLAELVRQRALVQEHLAWLNREIAHAADAAKSATAAVPTAAPVPATTASAPPAAKPRAPAASPASPRAIDADEIIAQYQATPANLKQDVRKGCLLYFSAALVLLGLVVTVLYIALRRTP
ncbi:MAG: hypothetical protein IT495_18490 [Gammaproteobacteria bacterium]|nr:hypothetical protein [Gammaproteobacteria bacterium]